MLPHRVVNHALDVQAADQIRVTFEVDAVKIESLTLHPVGGGVKLYGSWYHRIGDREEELDTQPNVMNHTMNMIDHAQFFIFVARVMIAAHGSEEIHL